MAVLGVLQFQWIGQVSDFQQHAMQVSLREPIKGTIGQVQDQINLLMSMFRPDADTDPSDRLRTYWDRYASWRANSEYGLMIRRILFYDIPSGGHWELTELLGQPPRIEHAAWGQDLAPVRKHLDEWSLEQDRLTNWRWAVTWMFHPQAMAIYRPIIAHEPNRIERFRNGRLTGFFVLELDLGFIRDRMIPEILSDQFRMLSVGSRYVVGIGPANSSVLVYDPVSGTEDESAGSLGDFKGYVLTPYPAAQKSDRIGQPDFNLRFPLSAENVNESMARRGAVQRVSLRTKLDIAQMLGPKRTLPGAETDEDSRGDSRSELQAVALGWPDILPRLIVIGDAPHDVYVRVKQDGVALTEEVNRMYKRSVAMGIVVLVLLLGSMAMAALSERNAAHLAALRVEAAASQSHQLRNPLAGITLLADNIANGALGPGEKVIEYGEKIRTSARHLNELVNRTVRLAAMDAPIGRYRLSLIDVSEIAKDAFEEARAVIEGAGFTAECSCPEGLPVVKADAEALRQSLSDLLGNAVKYGLPGRWLKIETDETGSGHRREVRIRVCDRGRGVSAREARLIFEPFYRAPDVLRSSISGSGLGLALARSAIQGMGGRLSLESERGRGSAFTIRFPVS